MPTIPCNNYVQIVQSEDICLGERKSASCVIDSSVYSEISLPANSTQQEINQALYLTAITSKLITDGLQTQIDLVDGSETKIIAGNNISIEGVGTISNPYIIESINTLTPPLEKITEGVNSGIVIRGRDGINYGNIGFNAVDLSYSSNPSNIFGSTGTYSFTTGNNNTSSGHSSTSMGGDNISSGQLSFTIGQANVASEDGTIAMGIGNQAIQSNATAIGTGNISSGEGAVTLGITNFARSYGEVSIGLNGTDYTPGGSIEYVATDRILNVGAGVNFATKKDVLTVLKNGLATLPSVTNTLIASASGKAIITKEYLPTISSNYVDDTAAAAEGILLGQMYHTAGIVKIRIV